MLKDLSLIILNFNTPELVAACLTSIKKYHLSQTHLLTEVIVVDNGSTDNSLENLKKKFSWVKFIEGKRNVGFAAGNNLALRQTHSRYVMLLNSDTELTATSNLQQLVEYLDQHPKVAVLTPKLLLDSGEIDLASHRGEPTPWVAFSYFSKLAKVFPQSRLFAEYHQTYQNFDEIHQVAACSGAAMLVRQSAIDRVGLLDEAFFMYAEDLDWCRRFRAAGFQIVYQPKSVIIHHKYKSGLSNTNQHLVQKTNAHFYDTMLQYYDKYYRTNYPFLVRELLKIFVNYKKATAKAGQGVT